MASYEDLKVAAKRVIDANNYMVLGTSDPTGRPWVSPVYFTPDAYIDFYWVSSSEALHSQNIARRPDISIVVFDSQVPIGAAEAVYMSARAEEIADSDLELCAEIYSGRLPEARGFGPEQLRAPALLRLYRATVAEHSILIRGGDPDHGRGVDSRMTLTLSR